MHVTTPLPPDLPGLTHVRLLGSGGFADVHLYQQELPRMLVAVKVLRASAGANLAQQLVDEANTMAELAEHPYIVTIFRAGTTVDGRAYLVMAYLPQPNLAVRARTQPLSVADALRTGVQLASAVETAHRARVLHRDIKPANVLMSSYGTPALADFGIAGRAETLGSEEEIGLSIAWAPPEVLHGLSHGSVAADVYSLTATIWYLLTGRTPFEQVGGDNSEDALVARTTHEPAPRTGRADVPESLERLLQHGMAKDPARRPRSALALATDLQAIEQELRLRRTDVVLLDRGVDEHPHTATGAPTRVRSVPASGATTDPSPAPAREAEATPARRRSWWPAALAGALAAGLLVGGGVVAGRRVFDDGNASASAPPSSAPPASDASSPTAGGTSTGSTGDPSASTSATGAAPTAAPTASTTGAATIDRCVVGTWRTTRHEEPALGITSLDRTLRFTEDGHLTITYDQARAGGAGMVFDGTVEYRVTTSNGTMSFELLRNGLTLDPPNPMAQPGTGSVRYTCSESTFTQSVPGFTSDYERV